MHAATSTIVAKLAADRSRAQPSSLPADRSPGVAAHLHLIDRSIMAGEGGDEGLVCVTGAGGFIGSWLVKELLQRGYVVRGTARDPEDRKNAHLRKLDGAEERLSMYRADVLDYSSLRPAFSLCGGVFHVACPVNNNEPDLVAIAVEGTRNVINAAADMGVRRVVFTSSYGAVHMNPNRSPDQIVDESCWSDLDFCKRTKNLYCYAKAVAERTAMEEAAKRGVELVVVVPAVTLGEQLHPTINATSIYTVMAYMMGARKAYPNAVAGYVDVQDVARAHVLVYEDHAAHGRYLCLGGVLHRAEFVQMMRDLFPQYPIPTKCADDNGPMVKPYKFSTQRLEALGMKFTPLKESLYKTMICLQGKGHVPILPVKSAL
ncbi:hypothetical protein ACP4OV_020624 [Aristida adscensionis]